VGDALVGALESTLSPHSLSSPQLSPCLLGWVIIPFLFFFLVGIRHLWCRAHPCRLVSTSPPSLPPLLLPGQTIPPALRLTLWKTPSSGASTPLVHPGGHDTGPCPSLTPPTCPSLGNPITIYGGVPHMFILKAPCAGSHPRSRPLSCITAKHPFKMGLLHH
jgi:hypothetical protein